MANLILIRLDCKEQEDWTGDDAIRIEVNGQKVWTGSMDTNEQKSLNDKAVPFQNQAVIKLWEEDWPDGDDHLGTVTVTEEGTVAAARAARFTLDDADYTLWYTVSADNNPQDLPPPDPTTPPDPANPGTPTPPAGPGGIGEPAAPCALGHVIFEVKDQAGQPVEAASVRVAARGLQGVTGPDGRADLGLCLPGQVVGEGWKKDYYPFPAAKNVIITDCSRGDTIIKLTLSRERIVQVTPPDQKWYVNLDADESRRFGRDLTATARLATKTPGVRIYFAIDEDPSNRKGLPGHMLPKLEPANALTDANGMASARLHLSRYGGDRFRVKASLSSDPATDPGVFSGWQTVWRRLFYEVDCMKRPGGGSFNTRNDTAGLNAAMATVFIELQQTGRDNAPPHQRIVTDGEAAGWTSALRDGTGAPRYFQLVFMDTIAWDEKESTEIFGLTAPKQNVTLQASNYTIDPRKWFVSATYRERVAGGKSGSLAQNRCKLTVDNPYDTYVIEIDLGGIAGLDPATRPVDVTLKFNSWSEGSGLQTGPATIIGCRWRERAFTGAQLTNSTLNTMMHEPGHAMGLAATTLPDGTAVATTYYKNGHHCSFNTNQCIMFESNTGATAFHPGCADACRGRDLSKLPQTGSDGY